MRLTVLKPLRVAFSLIFFFLILWLFVDGTGRISHELTRVILLFQFVPSAVTLINFATAASLGCILVLLLTLFFGRVYCSFLCPMGALHDLVTGLRTRLFRKRPFRFTKPQRWLQYCLLALTVIPLFFGSLFVLNFLDPYSLSGRIFSNLFRPVWYGAVNLVSWVLKQFNDFSVYPVEMKSVAVPSLVITAVLFAGIVLLAFFKGRWYCNAVCPVGTLLGLVSRFSLFRIRIREEACNQCGLCARNCKAGCIDQHSKTVDFSRCVACYNCFRTCRSGSFYYGFAWKPSGGSADPSRRTFLKQTVTGLTGVAGLLTADSLVAQNRRRNRNGGRTGDNLTPVTPPGSLSFRNFTSSCTACHLCISACPTRVLQPSFAEYGLSGLFIPKMDFGVSYCNYDCIRCTQVCPNEAIRTLTVEEKHLTRIGVARFRRNHCVVVTQGTACGACSEHCPTKAVEMVPYLQDLGIPEVDETLCIGCGACEYACPTRPRRAISVEPLEIHGTAMKPSGTTTPAPAAVKKEEEFPF